MMDPLRISLVVSRGYKTPRFPTHLDGLLAWVDTQDQMRYLGEGGQGVTVDALRALANDLPLAKVEIDGKWCWQASVLMPIGELLHSTRFYTRRRDREAYSTGVAAGEILHGRHKPGDAMTRHQYAIDTLRGSHRNLLDYYPVSSGATDGTIILQAWCIGDRAGIESRLCGGLVTHIGPGRRCGHGKVESIAVEIDESAHERWKLRAKPWSLLDDDEPIAGNCRPPYWDGVNRNISYFPRSLR